MLSTRRSTFFWNCSPARSEAGAWASGMRRPSTVITSKFTSTMLWLSSGSTVRRSHSCGISLKSEKFCEKPGVMP